METKQRLDHSGWPEHIRKTISSGDETIAVKRLTHTAYTERWDKTKRTEQGVDEAEFNRLHEFAWSRSKLVFLDDPDVDLDHPDVWEKFGQ